MASALDFVGRGLGSSPFGSNADFTFHLAREKRNV